MTGTKKTDATSKNNHHFKIIAAIIIDMLTTREIKTIEEFRKLRDQGEPMTNLAFHNMDLSNIAHELLQANIRDSLFLGCTLENSMVCALQHKNYIFPTLDVPYDVYPNKLYRADDLYAGFSPENPTSFHDTPDQVIFRHFIKTGKYTTDLKESLARALHDQSITNALEDFVIHYDPKSIIAIMGGHQLLRTSRQYRKIVWLAKHLTEQGKLMASGGGPGAMEATHLGAWLAGTEDKDVLRALEILSQAPSYEDSNWLTSAFQVIHSIDGGKKYSLGIPTWLYGHEPPTPFASHIAKYFTNSIREDGLLALAKGGIVFTPGRAGTTQEVFQEVTQNHYLTLEYASPMIFMGRTFWARDWPVYPLLYQLSYEGKLKNLDLGIYDTIEEIVAHLQRFYEK